MKQFKNYFLFFTVCLLSTMSYAQTADEIVEGYFEATGGRDAWSKVDNITFSAKVNQGGMDIPLEILQTKDGKSCTTVSFQGMTIKQGVFDGETLWNTNFQTMKAEKATSEDLENHMKTIGDFPDPLFNYKKNGYTLEMVGKESFDGTESHKLKLTKKPLTLEGKEVANVEFYFFDIESGVLLGTESEMKSGPMSGKTAQSKFSEYQEVDGLYFPFSMSQGEKGGMSQAIVVEKVVLNSDVDETGMKFPEEMAAPTPAEVPTTAPTSAPSKTTTTAPSKTPTTAPSGENK